ncbi:hypothetical protein A3758_29595 [Oleiphilus sp. HI0118]|nr:hypothetical protein A3758_29595 [Oleiphilus sp. HI0118]
MGYWRAVGHSHNGFVTETFVEACAEKAGQDAVEFRLALLRDQPRMAAVLKLAAHKKVVGLKSRLKDVIEASLCTNPSGRTWRSWLN